MNPLIRAALLLNAARAPLSAFEALRDEYGPESAWTDGEALWKRLGLRPSACVKLEGLLRERDWPERELERAEREGARFLTAELFRSVVARRSGNGWGFGRPPA